MRGPGAGWRPWTSPHEAGIRGATSPGNVDRLYLVKQTSAHFLVQAIRAIHKGNTFFSPAIARRLQRQREKVPEPREHSLRIAARLTSREVEALQLIAEGRPNKQIAVELGISVKTVDKHQQSLMKKLNIHDTTGLNRHASAAGIIKSSVQLTIIYPPAMG